MSQQIAVHIDTGPETRECRHHWLIETPQGATSRGVCKLCGQEKEFRNSFDGIWDREPGPEAGHVRVSTVKQIARDDGASWGDETGDF